MSYYQRHLPHWHPEGKSLFITRRLHGSLPRAVLDCRRGQAKSLSHPKPGEAFLKMDRELDKASIGPLWLKNPLVAQCVVDALRSGESGLNKYDLHAYVVMPNHVHVLLRPNVPLPKITQGIKGSTARFANQLLGRLGQPFWQDESYDHWVRHERSFSRVIAYIEGNPVSAGLVDQINDWPWSSASRTGF